MGVANMLIQVQYPDNRFDYVKDHLLHSLIDIRAIARFKRSSGWVTVGVDPVRQYNRGFHPTTNSCHLPVINVKNAIRVVYIDHCHGTIPMDKLDDLLETKAIMKFMRTTGWVTVGIDPVGKARRVSALRV